MTGPDFIGVGSSRCGTTSLYEALRGHPNVWVPPIKELKYWDVERGGRHRDPKAGRRDRVRFGLSRTRSGATRMPGDAAFMSRFIAGRRSDSWYCRLFPDQERCTGEITPGYCTLEEGEIAHIAQVVPDAQILVMLRDPIDRVWSSAVKSFVRDQGRPFSDLTGELLEDYFDRPLVERRSNYPRIVRTWREAFGEDRVWVGFLEDLEGRPAMFSESLGTFLGVASQPLSDAISAQPVANQSKGAGGSGGVPPEVEIGLARRFRPMVDELSQIVDGVPATWMQRIDTLLAT